MARITAASEVKLPKMMELVYLFKLFSYTVFVIGFVNFVYAFYLFISLSAEGGLSENLLRGLFFCGCYYLMNPFIENLGEMSIDPYTFFSITPLVNKNKKQYDGLGLLMFFVPFSIGVIFCWAFTPLEDILVDSAFILSFGITIFCISLFPYYKKLLKKAVYR
jgi:hypothetical protein